MFYLVFGLVVVGYVLLMTAALMGDDPSDSRIKRPGEGAK